MCCVGLLFEFWRADLPCIRGHVRTIDLIDWHWASRSGFRHLKSRVNKHDQHGKLCPFHVGGPSEKCGSCERL